MYSVINIEGYTRILAYTHLDPYIFDLKFFNNK